MTQPSETVSCSEATPAAPRISGHMDPEGEAPWAMQLVAHIEKTAPPTRSAVCEAAALAVVSLCTNVRGRPGGEWEPQLRRWLAGRIRKHCRRARGASWQRIQELPGITVSRAGAEVRAFVPGPLDAIAPEIARLQLSGSELDDPEAVAVADPLPGTVVISLSPEPWLGLGKAAAAAGHAAQLSVMQMDPARFLRWDSAGYPVTIEHPNISRWKALLETADVVINDAGLTEVAPGTVTAVARWG